MPEIPDDETIGADVWIVAIVGVEDYDIDSVWPTKAEAHQRTMELNAGCAGAECHGWTFGFPDGPEVGFARWMVSVDPSTGLPMPDITGDGSIYRTGKMVPAGTNAYVIREAAFTGRSGDYPPTFRIEVVAPADEAEHLMDKALAEVVALGSAGELAPLWHESLTPRQREHDLLAGSIASVPGAAG